MAIYKVYIIRRRKKFVVFLLKNGTKTNKNFAKMSKNLKKTDINTKKLEMLEIDVRNL